MLTAKKRPVPFALRGFAAVIVVAASLVAFTAGPAFASCSADGSNEHTLGGVFHGWDRYFCTPGSTYSYNGYTNHPHGEKYVEILNSNNGNDNCDDLESGSLNAFCSAGNFTTTNHESYHEAPTDGSCTARYSDGHGIDCHIMGASP